MLSSAKILRCLKVPLFSILLLSIWTPHIQAQMILSENFGADSRTYDLGEIESVDSLIHLGNGVLVSVNNSRFGRVGVVVSFMETNALDEFLLISQGVSDLKVVLETSPTTRARNEIFSDEFRQRYEWRDLYVYGDNDEEVFHRVVKSSALPQIAELQDRVPVLDQVSSSPRVISDFSKQIEKLDLTQEMGKRRGWLFRAGIVGGVGVEYIQDVGEKWQTAVHASTWLLFSELGADVRYFFKRDDRSGVYIGTGPRVLNSPLIFTLGLGWNVGLGFEKVKESGFYYGAEIGGTPLYIPNGVSAEGHGLEGVLPAITFRIGKIRR